MSANQYRSAISTSAGETLHEVASCRARTNDHSWLNAELGSQGSSNLLGASLAFFTIHELYPKLSGIDRRRAPSATTSAGTSASNFGHDSLGLRNTFPDDAQ